MWNDEIIGPVMSVHQLCDLSDILHCPDDLLNGDFTDGVHNGLRCTFPVFLNLFSMRKNIWVKGLVRKSVVEEVRVVMEQRKKEVQLQSFLKVLQCA